MPKFKETDDFVVDLRSRAAGASQENTNKERGQPELFAGEQKSLWHFVQYNNAFLVVLVVGIIAFSGLVFASEDVRSSTIGSKQVRSEGVDNTLLLEADLDNFSMDFTIAGILEDDEKYLVSYSFVDLDLVENFGSEEGKGAAWQYVEKTAARRIAKPFRKDLGVYLARQLAQDAKSRLKELKKEQTKAKSEGQTKVVQVTEYSGLIGKVLDLSSAVFPSYKPVKKIEIETPLVNQRVRERAASGASDSLTNVYNEWVNDNQDLVSNLNGGAPEADAGADSGVTADNSGGANSESGQAGSGEQDENARSDSDEQSSEEAAGGEGDSEISATNEQAQSSADNTSQTETAESAGSDSASNEATAGQETASSGDSSDASSPSENTSESANGSSSEASSPESAASSEPAAAPAADAGSVSGDSE